MNIELKRIEFSERMSEETNCFTADLYIDGKKVGYAKNDGHGGCTNYGANKAEDWDIIKKAEAYCKTLPPKVYDFGKFDMDLEGKIDDLLSEWLKAKDDKKFQAKMQKDMLKGIVLKTDKGYETLTWKGHTIASLLQRPDGKMVIQQQISKLKKEGREILNTNLPQDILA